jgi:hypothetical protein
MARRKSLRSQLYRGARDLGNLEAGEKRPTIKEKLDGFIPTASGFGRLRRATSDRRPR